MNQFNQRLRLRIGIVSLVLAMLSGTLAWLIAIDHSQREIAGSVIVAAQRLLRTSAPEQAFEWSSQEKRHRALHMLAATIFDSAALYDEQGKKQIEASPAHASIKPYQFPGYQPEALQGSSYQISQNGSDTALSVFIPLQGEKTGDITGYLQGIHFIPRGQDQEITHKGITAALLTGVAVLLCGLSIYPAVSTLSAENGRKTVEMLDSHISMMEALGRAIAKRDSDTGGHNYRVAWIAARIGEELGLTGKAMQTLIIGSFLHDVGKIGIPDAILLKPSRLNKEEMLIMRNHVSHGEEIIKGMGWLEGAHEVVAAHHEKWDGSGYPRQLSGESIPLAARIFALADVFDALASKRIYKKSLPFAEVMDTLRKDQGTHFDPRLMAVFEQIANEVDATLEEASEQQARMLLEEKIRKHFTIF